MWLAMFRHDVATIIDHLCDLSTIYPWKSEKTFPIDIENYFSPETGDLILSHSE